MLSAELPNEAIPSTSDVVSSPTPESPEQVQEQVPAPEEEVTVESDRPPRGQKRAAEYDAAEHGLRAYPKYMRSRSDPYHSKYFGDYSPPRGLKRRNMKLHETDSDLRGPLKVARLGFDATHTRYNRADHPVDYLAECLASSSLEDSCPIMNDLALRLGGLSLEPKVPMSSITEDSSWAWRYTNGLKPLHRRIKQLKGL